MTTGGWAWLLRRELLARPGRSLLLVACAALTGLVAALSFHVLAYLRGEVRPWVEAMFPERRLVVRPTEMDVAFLKLETGRLDAAAVQRLLALDGVQAVYPQAPVQFPISAEGGIGGMTYASDIVVHGAPAGLIARELGDPSRFAWDPRSGQPVPVAASAYFLDLYNIGLAESAGLPKLSRSAAIGRTFELILGESSVGLGSAGRPRRQQARIVALVSDPNLVGMVAPLEVVEAWNREFAPRKPQSYTRVHVDAATAMDVPAVRAAIEEQGFSVTAAGERLNQARSLVGGVEVAALSGLVVVLLLAGVGIGSTTIMAARERRAQWGLQRATGLRPGALALLVTAEGAVLAAVACVPALGGAVGALLWARAGLGERIAQSGSIPGDPLALAWTPLAAAAALVAAMVLVPTWIALAGALWKEPVRLLEEKSL